MRFVILIFLFIIIPIALGDIHTTKVLYSEGCAITESALYRSIEFRNEINLDPANVYSEGSFKSAGNGDNAGGDSLVSISIAGPDNVYADLKAQGTELQGSKDLFAGGAFSSVQIDYSLANGDVDAKFHNDFVRASEEIHFSNSIYSGSLIASTEYIYGGGRGRGYAQGDSSRKLEHISDLRYLDKSCNIQSTLSTIADEGIRPVSFGWSSGMASSRMNAFLGQNARVISGDSYVEAHLYGTSSEILPKEESINLAPLNLETADPENSFMEGTWFDDPDFNKLVDILQKAGLAQEIYMSYYINTPS